MLAETKILTGAEIILKILKQNGVNKIFGYPGSVVLKIYDELYEQNDIQHILVRHEQSAVHAAEGYARVTGKVGVVLVTSGPGATNTVSGINNAYLDGFPLVVLTGQVNANLIGKDAFQEANICDITKSCTKKVYQVTAISQLQDVLNDAFYVANSGKKGPVLVDLAKNVLYESTYFKPYTLKNETIHNKYDVINLINEINNSKYPLIVAGGGSVNAYKELRILSEIWNIPAVTTMMGTGVFTKDYKTYLGMIGIFGDNSANEALKQSDLIFSIGARFNDRITCCFDKTKCKFIQLDINENEINKNILSSMSIIADSKDFLTKLIDFAKPVITKWDYAKLKALNIKRKTDNNKLHSFEVMYELNKFIKNKDITVTTEVGQHQLWAVQGLEFEKPLKFLSSCGSGTMGFGLPAAIGATIADNSKPVICITGDGSFQMNLTELATCKDYSLPVKIMIMNNGYLGMVRQLQQNQCCARYSETKISNPDFEKIAQSYGIEYFKVNSKLEISKILNRAFIHNNTSIIEFIIEPFEML